MSRLVDLLSLTELKRWNVVPTTKTQTVAEHSFAVAVIALEITERLAIAYRAKVNGVNLERVIRWSMVHDGPECLTGDLPSNLKLHLENRGIDLEELETDLCPWYEGEKGILTVPEEAIVSIADAIEAGGWLSKYGAAGTQPIVDELKRKAMKRAKEYAILFYEDPDHAFVKVVGEVAAEVWKGEIPILLEQGRVDEAFKGGKEKPEASIVVGPNSAPISGTQGGSDEFSHCGEVRPSPVRRYSGGSA